ncbi:synaptic vesicle glycoprotein 2B-like isoform X2 [Anastrepha ludens]|uniref:synaptic vesicle glycoprotein 2B-like isoform X2 n=1 Tax=Anastrepha ludens TaxID=28586 RepID=UPI0023B14C66|nr:synaptic vesicle glycoprotein 2B-like isoform X2 [Anastrepha ludens]
MSRKFKEDEPVDFEKAMDTAGFGIFNYVLLLVGVFAALASVFETSTMSYILPVAECDLEMTLRDKGLLNAATYAGMITSAIIWGYLADTLGRRKVLIFGYLADTICVFSSSLTQNFQMLVAFKFLGGFIVNGPGAVLFTYLTELHPAKQRPRVLMILGMINSLATLALPLIAWAIFPRAWNFLLFDSLQVYSWQIFLAVCGIPSLIGGLSFIFLPESPKFLMSQGRNAEALHSFQKIYALNQRVPMHTYPIKQLVEEVPNRGSNVNEHVFTVENKPVKPKFKREARTFTQAVRDGMIQIKPMFKKPLLGHSLHAYALQFLILLGLNTIRLWLPQLFASIGEYEALETSKTESANLCTILEYSVNKTAVVTDFAEKCSERPEISVDLYINNIIVSITGLVGYCFAGMIVKVLGAKRLLTFGLLISGCLGIGLYWSVSGLSTLIMSSAFVTICSVSTSSLMGIVIALFPTSLRSLVVATAMMFGRLGALSGNLVFPIFMEMGCIQPFLMVGLVLLAASALSVILPSGTKFNLT